MRPDLTSMKDEYEAVNSSAVNSSHALLRSVWHHAQEDTSLSLPPNYGKTIKWELQNCDFVI